MKKALGYFQKIENGVLIGTFIIMVIASFVQVLNRNIFHLGISWLEELSRYCMIYMALLAAEIGLRDGTQIAVTALTDKLKGTFKNVVEIIAKVVVCAFAVTVFVTSFKLLWMQSVSNQVSPGLGLPMIVPYFAITFSFAIISIVQVSTLVNMVIKLFTGEKEASV